MIGFYRSAVRIPKWFTGVLSVALGCSFVFVSPSEAAITLTDDVIPSPAVGDPWDVGGSLSIGETLNGTMTVDADSDVTNTDGYVANIAGSTGTVTVNGTGSTWTNSGELRMGNFGTGTLNITGGGAVSVGGNGRLGNVVGGIGTATVDGSGSTLTSANFILVGREGTGTLDIQNSGVVSDSIGGIAIFEGSTGAATIDGPGSSWSNLNELQVADGGTATLNILNGGIATSPRGFLGVTTDGIGTATVSGIGSAWNNSDQLQVGYGGTGILNINSGATVSANFGYLGSLVGGTGTATVSGAGSTWTNFSTLSVGYEGAGTLNIEQAALVSATALDGSGRVNFDGGTLRIVATDSAGNTLTLHAGGGTLDVATATTNVTITSDIGGTGGFTKAGAGTLELTGANTYAGDTRLAAGPLNISQVYLNDLADVYLALGTSLGLNFSGTDLIDSLFIDGDSKPVGTYGAIDSGADFEMEIFSGTGLLRVSTVGVLGDYNDDGIVDVADYTVWRDRLDSITSLPNDDTAGVGPDDYDRWKSNFGQSAGAGSGSAGASPSLAAVPEPATVVLLILAVASLCLGRGRTAWKVSAIP